MKRSSWRMVLSSGRMPLVLCLIMVGLFGCERAVVQSVYRVTIPELEAEPFETPCKLAKFGDWRHCVCYLDVDSDKIITELKAACLALGGSHAQCQTENRASALPASYTPETELPAAP